MASSPERQKDNMKRLYLTHPDWTDKQCLQCGTTLTKQEIAAGHCFVCKTPNKPLDRFAERLAHIGHGVAICAGVIMLTVDIWLFVQRHNLRKDIAAIQATPTHVQHL